MNYTQNIYSIEYIQKLECIIDATGLGTWEWNVQTGEVIFNEKWASIIGYTLKELQPTSIKTWIKYAHPDDLQKSNEILEAHFKGETDAYEFESRMKHKNGDWIWVLDKGKVISYTNDGKPEWMVGSHQDITVRKNRENALDKYKSLLNEASEVAKIGIWDLNLHTMKTEWSKVTKEIHEVPNKFASNVANGIAFYKKGENQERIKIAFNSCLENGTPFNDKFQIITYKGNEKWVRAIGIPKINEGQIIGVYGLFQDITEKMKIFENNALLTQLFENSVIGIAVLNTKGEFIKSNDKFKKTMKYSSDDLLHLNFKDLIHPDDLKDYLNSWMDLISGNINTYQIEKRCLINNGKTIWVSFKAKLMKGTGNFPDHILTQVYEITKEKDANKKLDKLYDSPYLYQMVN